VYHSEHYEPCVCVCECVCVCVCVCEAQEMNNVRVRDVCGEKKHEEQPWKEVKCIEKFQFPV